MKGLGKMKKITGQSYNSIRDNIEKLKTLFPEIVSDDKIDLDKLRVLIGDEIDNRQERYEFTWHGKTEAMQLAQMQTTGTLRPNKEKSYQWEQTKNLYIEGDNLEVLRVMQHAYRNKVKMIYIDPPYNTSNDFVYHDDFRDNVANYKKRLDESYKSNADTSGRYHTNWLNMMYPRLKIARNLLKPDGVIFISIDERELANLKKICDEIFGEDNFVELFVWTKTSTPPSLSTKSRKTVEYILCYEKNRNNQKYKGELLDYGDAPLLNTGNPLNEISFPPGTIKFNIPDGTYEKGTHGRLELVNDLIVENGVNANEVKMIGEYKWVQSTVDEEIRKGTYFLIKSKNFSIRFQRKPDQESYKAPTNYISKKQMEIELNSDVGIGTNETASNELKALGMGGYFDYPKPVGLIKYLVRATTDQDDLVMDFFAGSSTTAQAVMELNAEDGGNRRFIMVQIPEPIDEKSKAYQDGFKTITDIGQERIRRAGQKIAADLQEKDNGMQIDIGFKVFSLDETNLKLWDQETDDLEGELWQQVEPIKEGRTEEDVVYEILLKYGIELTVPIEKELVDDYPVYVVETGTSSLLICLARDLSLEFIDTLANNYQHCKRMVFYDEGFQNDTVRINAQQIFKRNGIEDVRVI